MIQYFKRLFGIAPSLRFDRIRGFGLLACADCGHAEEITAFTHGRDDTCCGHQCQACGAFAGLSKPKALTCGCGGLMARDRALFCPACRGGRLSYSMAWMT